MPRRSLNCESDCCSSPCAVNVSFHINNLNERCSFNSAVAQTQLFAKLGSFCRLVVYSFFLLLWINWQHVETFRVKLPCTLDFKSK